MRYVVGIDAGGTKTVGLLADETAAVVAEARGMGANLQTDGELQVEKVFAEIMDTLSAHHPISAVCLGIAGVDRPHDEGVIRGILRRLGHRENARVVNDGESNKPWTCSGTPPNDVSRSRSISSSARSASHRYMSTDFEPAAIPM